MFIVGMSIRMRRKQIKQPSLPSRVLRDAWWLYSTCSGYLKQPSEVNTFTGPYLERRHSGTAKAAASRGIEVQAVRGET